MPERGFSLLEVMIAVAILAVALTALLGNIGSLDRAHHANRETAKAQEIAQILAERIQGAQWSRLGGPDEPWSWHRRVPRDATDTTINPPLTETATAVASIAGVNRVVDNLLVQPPGSADQGVGILRERSGLDALAVHVEYYRPAATASAASWTARAAYALPEQPVALAALNEAADPVLVRIVVRWRPLGITDTAAQPVRRMYELVLVRGP